jgi:hypothetical protein
MNTETPFPDNPEKAFFTGEKPSPLRPKPFFLLFTFVCLRNLAP